MESGGDGNDTLQSIERLIFTDQLIALGPRADEVARVAFVLWTPDIVGSASLFSRGLSFYDVGYDFATLCSVVLQFWPQQGEDFARVPVRGARGTTQSVADAVAMSAFSCQGAAACGGGSAMVVVLTGRAEAAAAAWPHVERTQARRACSA